MADLFPTRPVIKRALFRLLLENGTVHIRDAYDQLADVLDLSPDQRSIERAGDQLYKHEIRFARLELEHEGLMQSYKVSGRGVWKLADGLSAQPSTLPVEEGKTFVEGAVHCVYVSKYERSPEARSACLAHHGYVCSVCGFDFARTYGPLGEGVIHVHHLISIADIGHDYIVDPVHDLVPLCANCHQMAHRRDPAFTPQELRRMIAAAAMEAA